MIMKTTLENLLNEYEIYDIFKKELTFKGYSCKDLVFINFYLKKLDIILYNECMISLNEVLRKTYYRVLVRIDKGYKNLLRIIKNPSEWVINNIDKDREAWVSNDVLIFTTETTNGTKTAAFSHINRNSIAEYKYQDNKWQ